MDGETPKRLYSDVVASGVQQGCFNGSVAGKDNRMVILNPNAKKLKSKSPRAVLYPKCWSSGLCVEDATLKLAAAARRMEKSVDSKRIRSGAAAGEEKKPRKSKNHYSTKPITREMKPRDSKMSGSTSQDAATRRVKKPFYQAAKEKKPRDFKTSGAKVNGADAKEKKPRKWKSYYPRVHKTGERKKLMDLDFSGFTWKGAEPTEMGKLQDSPSWSSTAVQSAELLEKAGDPTLVSDSLQPVVPTTMESSEDPTLVGGSLQPVVPTMMEGSGDPTLIGGSLQPVVPTMMDGSGDPTRVGGSLQPVLPMMMESSEDPTLVSDSLQPVVPTMMESSGDLTFLDRISKLAHDSQSLLERLSGKLHYPQDCNDGNIDDDNSENVTKMLSGVLQDDEPIHVINQEVSALLKSERGQTASDPLLQTMHPRSENPPIPESFSMWNWAHPCNPFRPTQTETSQWPVGASSLEKEAVAEASKVLLQNDVTDSRATQSCRTPEHEILGSGPREQETTTQDVADPLLVHPLTIKLKSERDIYKAKAEKERLGEKSALINVHQLQEELKALKEAVNAQAALKNRRHVPHATGTPTSQTDRNTLETQVHRHNVAKRHASSSIPYPFLPSTILYPFLPSTIMYPFLPSTILYLFLPSTIPEYPSTSSDAAGGDQSSSDSQPNTPVHQNPVYQLFSLTSSGDAQSSSDSQPNAPATCGDARGHSMTTRCVWCLARRPAFELDFQSSNPNHRRLNEVYPKPIHRAPQPVWSNGYITRPMPDVPVTVTPDGSLS